MTAMQHNIVHRTELATIEPIMVVAIFISLGGNINNPAVLLQHRGIMLNANIFLSSLEKISTAKVKWEHLYSDRIPHLTFFNGSSSKTNQHQYRFRRFPVQNVCKHARIPSYHDLIWYPITSSTVITKVEKQRRFRNHNRYPPLANLLNKLSEIWAPFQYKDRLFRHGTFFKDDRPSYLHDENSHSGNMPFLNWDTPLMKKMKWPC